MKKLAILSKFIVFAAFCLCSFLSKGQAAIPVIKDLKELKNVPSGISNYWFEMGTNTLGNPILIPVIVMQGKTTGPTLGLIAAIHGNELNGIPIMHRLVDSIDTEQLQGRIIAIPGLNAVSVQMDRRRFVDEEDLNRNFPGKKHGNRSQQYVYRIKENILPSFDLLRNAKKIAANFFCIFT